MKKIILFLCLVNSVAWAGGGTSGGMPPPKYKYICSENSQDVLSSNVFAGVMRRYPNYDRDFLSVESKVPWTFFLDKAKVSKVLSPKAQSVFRTGRFELRLDTGAQPEGRNGRLYIPGHLKDLEAERHGRIGFDTIDLECEVLLP